MSNSMRFFLIMGAFLLSVTACSHAPERPAYRYIQPDEQVVSGDIQSAVVYEDFELSPGQTAGNFDEFVTTSDFSLC